MPANTLSLEAFMEISAAVIHEPHQPFAIETLELNGPRDDEILVRMVAVGLCHSDILAAEQVLPVTMPVVLGHEGAGVVEAVGRNVTKVVPGDHVVMTFNSCGECASCRTGEQAYCLQFVPLNYSGKRRDGTALLHNCGKHAPVNGNFFGQSSFASMAIGNERNVVKVDKSAPLQILAPFGCGVQTGAGTVMLALKAEAGSSIAVFGGGPVGLSAVLGAAVQGCGTIILVEPVASRRALALELGATHAVDPKAGVVAEAINAIVPGGVKYAVETSGAAAVFDTLIDSVGHRGTVALVGVPSRLEQTVQVNVLNALVKGLTLTAVVEGNSVPDDFIPQLAALHASGKFPVEKMVKTYKFDQINEAVAAQKRGDCVKVVLTFD